MAEMNQRFRDFLVLDGHAAESDPAA